MDHNCNTPLCLPIGPTTWESDQNSCSGRPVDEVGSTRKKLRLSNQQSAVLEETFSDNKFPKLSQKKELATQMNLHPRQVEVWFQNKRARTKINKTKMENEVLIRKTKMDNEVLIRKTKMDNEVLKRFNESLEYENRRLHKEVRELSVLKMECPVTVCPSCEKVSIANNIGAFTLSKVNSISTRGVAQQ